MFRCKASRSNLVRRTLFPHVVKNVPGGERGLRKCFDIRLKTRWTNATPAPEMRPLPYACAQPYHPVRVSTDTCFDPIMSYLHGIADNFWFSLMWWDGHVGVQNNCKMSLKFCIIIESNSVHQNGRRDVTWKPRIVACWLLYNLPLEGVTGADWNSMYAFGQSEKR